MQQSNVWLATALLNARVRNSAGENLGKIEDVVLDDEGRIQYVVLSLGGALGAGDRHFPIHGHGCVLRRRAITSC